MRSASLLIGASLAIAGCAHSPGQVDENALFDGVHFEPRPIVSSPAEIFALNDAMRAFVGGEVAERSRQEGSIRGLYEALHDTVKLGYDTAVTRTASEAFDARAGNCLSLVILTGALAKTLNVPVQYQEVFGEETWSRDEGIAFLSGHVNILLGRGVVDRDRGTEVTIDFLPSLPVHSNTRPIGETTVIAMFLNNRAVEALTQGDLDTAYAYGRASMERDPKLNLAYNTLGVILSRHGDAVAAERVLRLALAREPENPEVLSNLAHVVGASGRTEEAEALRAQAAKVEAYPPFWFMDQGMAALQRGENLAARKYFELELKRMPYADDVHFALAVVSLRLGDVKAARAHLKDAIENSTSQDRHDIYAAKLAHLRNQGTPR